MRNNKTPRSNIELMITSTSNTAANVNVTLPLYDPDFLQTLVVQRGQPVMVRVFVFVTGTNTPPVQPRFSSDSRTNNVVRSYTLTHNEELKCTCLTNSKSWSTHVHTFRHTPLSLSLHTLKHWSNANTYTHSFASLLHKSGILFLSLSVTALIPCPPSKLALKRTSSDSVFTCNSFSAAQIFNSLSLLSQLF